MQQEKLFKFLQEEQVEYAFKLALPLSQIAKPRDAPPPSLDLVLDVKERGVIEPLLLQIAGASRYAIISGKRRYLAALKSGRETVPALITNVSIAQRDVLCMKLNRMRAENLLADIEATRRLMKKRLDPKQIGGLTGLKLQEIRRRQRLALADPRLLQAMREGHCAPSVAEAVAKLLPQQQQSLMDRFVDEGMKRLTMREVHQVKDARSQAAVDALPLTLFTIPYDLPVNGNGHHAGGDPQQWLHGFAGRLWETLLELERTGGLDLKNNQQSRRANSKARQLISEIKAGRDGLDSTN